MHDPCIGWDDAKVIESFLAPTEKRVPFFVAAELDGVVFPQCVGCAEVIDLYGVIDDQFSGGERVDGGGPSPNSDHSIAHSGQVDDGRYARKILQYHARRRECDFRFRFRFRIPRSQCSGIIAGYIDAVFVAQEIL